MYDNPPSVDQRTVCGTWVLIGIDGPCVERGSL